MTLAAAELKTKIESLFTDVEEVSGDVVRFTRRDHDSPFAVYYIDFGNELPKNPQTLTEYQDRVIGSRYFQDKLSLQWSNYLYFALPEEDFGREDIRQAKTLIEGDVTYARKFVVSREELVSKLAPKVVSAQEGIQQASVVNKWMGMIRPAGLESVFESDESLKARVALIETGVQKPRRPRKLRKIHAVGDVDQFIKTITLNQYRPRPFVRKFLFGRVNLLAGNNGSGKTSLLEAIELFYCGKHRRDPNAFSPYEIEVRFFDGHVETAKRTEKKDFQIFRDRNLAWYGRDESNNWDLCDSFGRFLFLDTDAAVRMSNDSNDPEDVNEYLATLLVGPDAAKLWRSIELLHDAVDQRLLILENQKDEKDLSLASMTANLKDAGPAKFTSKSIHARLIKLLEKHQWKMPTVSSEDFGADVLEAMSELSEVLEQIAACNWIPSPLNFANITTWCEKARASSIEARNSLNTLRENRTEEADLTESLGSWSATYAAAEQLKKFVVAGIPNRLTELAQQTGKLNQLTTALDGVDLALLQEVLSKDGSSPVRDFTVTAYRDAARKSQSTAETQLATRQTQYGTAVRTRDEVQALAEELRAIARQIIERSPTADICPLCHTRFGEGELEAHINLDVDMQAEKVAATLLDGLNQAKLQIEGAKNQVACASMLVDFCSHSGFDQNETVATTLKAIEFAVSSCEIAKANAERIERELRALEAKGLSAVDFELARDELQVTSRLPAKLTESTIETAIVELKRELEKSVKARNAMKKKGDELQRHIERLLGIQPGSEDEIEVALGVLEERLERTELLRGQLAELVKTHPWPEEKPIVRFLVDVEAVRTAARELVEALGTEREASQLRGLLTAQVATLKKDVAELSPKIVRLKSAKEVLGKIRLESPITAETELALKEIRSAIESIFLAIHAPNDFQKLGSSLYHLVRRESEKEVELHQISTGQRSAYALSIFLAQNAQVKKGPPLLLLDDPISHIDDLNCLSFLDYLREVALSGQRQIFFATANEKLASLVQRKFDFLGTEEFCRIDLNSNPTMRSDEQASASLSS